MLLNGLRKGILTNSDGRFYEHLIEEKYFCIFNVANFRVSYVTRTRALIKQKNPRSRLFASLIHASMVSIWAHISNEGAGT